MGGNSKSTEVLSLSVAILLLVLFISVPFCLYCLLLRAQSDLFSKVAEIICSHH